MIERAQFARNSAVYLPDAIPVPEYAADGRRYSLLEYILRQTEQIQGRVRRYTSPDEHAFYPKSVPALVLPPITYPEVRGSARHGVHTLSPGIVSYYQDVPSAADSNHCAILSGRCVSPHAACIVK